VSKYIIGGGIAGLIASFYNQEYQIISDNIGGQMVMNNAGPRILEANEYSEAFLKDLGLTKLNIKTAKIGYKVDGRIVDSITNELRLQYYLKSRCITNASNVPSSIMSDGKNTIEYFDIDWNEIVSVLVNSIKKEPIIGKIEFIETDNKSLGINTENGPLLLNYKNIVSTIPAPIFFSIASTKPKISLKCVPKIFFIVSNSYIDIGDYDYVYFPEDKYDFHRISNVGNGKVAIEYTTHSKLRNIVNKWTHYTTQYFSMPIGQIQDGKVQNIDSISFLGRYASWNHDIKTDDIIKICKEGDIYGQQ